MPISCKRGTGRSCGRQRTRGVANGGASRVRLRRPSERMDGNVGCNNPPEPSAGRRGDRPASSVAAELGYLRPMVGRPYNYMFEPPDGGPWHNCEYDLRQVEIADARSADSGSALDEAGFELWDAPSRISTFDDDEEVVRRY